jgi:hypothetical protein
MQLNDGCMTLASRSSFLSPRSSIGSFGGVHIPLPSVPHPIATQVDLRSLTSQCSLSVGDLLKIEEKVLNHNEDTHPLGYVENLQLVPN